MRWHDLTPEQLAATIADGRGLAILPVGATEQHGEHLPLCVDTLSVESVALAAGDACAVPVLPTLPYGCSQGHSRTWPGTISLRPTTLSLMIREIADWVHSAGCQRLLLLNGHYTNVAPMRCALEDIRVDLPGLRIGLRSLWDLSPELEDWYHADGANWHANQAETSLMLHLREDLVRMDRAVDEPDRAADHIFSYTVDQETPSGIVGTATAGSRREGADLMERLTSDLVNLIRRALIEEPPLEPAS